MCGRLTINVRRLYAAAESPWPSNAHVASIAAQSNIAVAGVHFGSGPVPALTIGFDILFALLYPLGREKHHKITRELELRRNAAQGETK